MDASVISSVMSLSMLALIVKTSMICSIGTAIVVVVMNSFIWNKK